MAWDKADEERFAVAARMIEKQIRENPGIEIPVDPDLAEYMGCFKEDAISETDAIESHIGVDENGCALGADEVEEH